MLQGKSYQEVSDIIAESKHEANVELIVSRSMGSRRAAQATWRQSVAHRGMRFIHEKRRGDFFLVNFNLFSHNLHNLYFNTRALNT